MKLQFNLKLIRYSLLIIILYAGSSIATAAEDTFFKSSCKIPFPESMSFLQELIKKQGYTISRIQHVDKGLKARGYETGLYRVVFFGKKDEIKYIREQYPMLIPYIPLNITIYEDKNRTGISTINPKTLYSLYKSDKIKTLMNNWHESIVNIFNQHKLCNF